MTEATKGILVPLPTAQLPATSATQLAPMPEQTLEQMAELITAAHAGVANAIASTVERGLTAGVYLRKAKERLAKGRFEPFVNRCGMNIRTAQSYMQLARRETELRQLLAEQAQGIAPTLTMHEALAHVRRLDAKTRPKRKPKRSLAFWR
jgi:hypothetical protein